MAKRKGSLLWQLTLSLGLVIVFLSVSSFYYQLQVEKRILIQNIRADMMSQASLLRVWLTQSDNPVERLDAAERYLEVATHREEAGRQIVIVDAESKIIAENTGDPRGKYYPDPALAEAMGEDRPEGGVARIVGDRYVVALPCFADPTKKKLMGAVLLRQPLTEIDQLTAVLMLGEFIVLAVTLVIIVGVVHLVLRAKVHKPMQAIFMQEYRIREGDLATIEAEDPANEFSDLYAMYNEMVLRIAEQKKAIIDQKDHVALARLVRQSISKLTQPLDEILTKSRELLERSSSLSKEDENTLKQIIGNITRIARELKAIVVEGSKSATWLQHEADKIREYQRLAGDEEGAEEAAE